jgi:hypothetical protein
MTFVEQCLRAAPEFVNRHRQGDPAREEMTVLMAQALTLRGVVKGSAGQRSAPGLLP